MWMLVHSSLALERIQSIDLVGRERGQRRGRDQKYLVMALPNELFGA